MNLQNIREQRAGHVDEMRRLLALAESEKRSLSPKEQEAFDGLKTLITELEGQEARAQFLIDAERRMMGTPADGGDRSFNDLQKRVSVLDVLQAQMSGRPLDGAAAEYHKEAERRSGRRAQGVFIPMLALETRTPMTTSGAGDIVPTDHRPDQYIGPLRNALLARRLGVRVLSGLSGDVTIPKHGSSTAVGWVAEGGALSPSSMTFDSVSLSPKHAGGMTEFSRQLIQQSSPDIEQLLREDLAAMIAQAIDSALLIGGGSDEPDGVIANVGTNGGATAGTMATPSWKEVLEMIEEAELENASVTTWVTHPECAKLLRSTLKASGIPGYLLENGHMAERPLYVTNQLSAVTSSNGGVVILGDWTQALLGIWSELDVLVNPYSETAYTKGNVLIRAMATVDVALRHPEAFVVAEDLPV